LICDGHTPHIGVGLIENARKENVVILKLPPHTRHVLQPMDLSVFRPLKLMWDEEVIKWQRRNYARKLPKSTFSSIISKIWKNISQNIIQIGFQKAEIFFFCDSVVLNEQTEPEACRRWSSFKESQETATLPSASHAEGAATSLLLRFHADEIVSHPSAKVISISHNKTFEELLLEQVKQMPHVRTGRKWICGGAEVITSGEVSERMKETVSKNVKDRNTKEKKNNQEIKQPRKKKLAILNP